MSELMSELPKGPSTDERGLVMRCEGAEFRPRDQLSKIDRERLSKKGLKPIEKATFKDIQACNRDHLRTYCAVYKIKKREKAGMELDMARFVAAWHYGKPGYDISLYLPSSSPSAIVSSGNQGDKSPAGPEEQMSPVPSKLDVETSENISDRIASSFNASSPPISRPHRTSRRTRRVSGWVEEDELGSIPKDTEDRPAKKQRLERPRRESAVRTDQAPDHDVSTRDLQAKSADDPLQAEKTLEEEGRPQEDKLNTVMPVVSVERSPKTISKPIISSTGLGATAVNPLSPDISKDESGPERMLISQTLSKPTPEPIQTLATDIGPPAVAPTKPKPSYKLVQIPAPRVPAAQSIPSPAALTAAARTSFKQYTHARQAATRYKAAYNGAGPAIVQVVENAASYFEGKESTEVVANKKRSYERYQFNVDLLTEIFDGPRISGSSGLHVGMGGSTDGSQGFDLHTHPLGKNMASVEVPTAVLPPKYASNSESQQTAANLPVLSKSKDQNAIEKGLTPSSPSMANTKNHVMDHIARNMVSRDHSERVTELDKFEVNLRSMDAAGDSVEKLNIRASQELDRAVTLEEVEQARKNYESANDVKLIECPGRIYRRKVDKSASCVQAPVGLRIIKIE